MAPADQKILGRDQSQEDYKRERRPRLVRDHSKRPRHLRPRPRERLVRERRRLQQTGPGRSHYVQHVLGSDVQHEGGQSAEEGGEVEVADEQEDDGLKSLTIRPLNLSRFLSLNKKTF